MRIGAVNYLNSKPLVYGLAEAMPSDRLLFDLPSRLADSLVAGRLDVALVPIVEWLRQPRNVLVSDACVACRGPVLSVKLYFRVPPSQVRRLALDEGSRTSAALAMILLDELAGTTPACEPLAIGCGLESSDADAVLLIGDRAIQSREPGVGSQEPGVRSQESGVGGRELGEEASRVRGFTLDVWDLGERWTGWTGLPFVFAAWVARPDVDTGELAAILSAARDRGVASLPAIAAAESPRLGIDTDAALHYLRHNLHFTLGSPELQGLQRFARLCAHRGLAPASAVRLLEQLPT